MIIINPVVNDDKSDYYYKIFLEKGWYKEFNAQYL